MLYNNTSLIRRFLVQFSFLFFVLIDLFGQSSDRIRYYVLYDVSASVKNQDPKKNNKLLFERLLNLTNDGKSLDSRVSLEVHFFGEKIKNDSRSIDLFTKSSRLKSQEKSLTKYISDLSKVDTIQDYTHIHNGLKQILSLEDSKWNETFGVFIITDGQLKVGDINTSKLNLPQKEEEAISVYIDSVEMKIKSLEKLNKPVFIIQSSSLRSNEHESLNDYFPVNKYLSNSIDLGIDSLIIGDRFFWVNNKVDLSKDPAGKFLRYFDSFMMDANSTIIEANSFVKSPKKNIVGRAIAFNNIIEATQSVEFQQLKANGDIVGSSIEQINELINFNDELKSKNNLTYQEIKDLEEKIDTFLSTENLKESMKELFTVSQEAARKKSILIPSFSEYDETSETVVSAGIEAKKEVQDVDDFANELSSYLIERTKNEAFYFFYENLNDKLFKKSTYLKDTLFNHFSMLVVDSIDFNLVLLTQALKKDIEMFPEKLMLHPKINNSSGLLGLYHSYFLLNELAKNQSLESAFKSLNGHLIKVVDKDDHLQLGLLFVTELIAYLHDNNLQDAFEKQDEESLNRITKILAVNFASKYSELGGRNLDEMSKKVATLYENYSLIRKQIIELELELKELKPSGDLFEFKRYKQSLVFNILNKVVELMISGIDISEHFTNEDDIAKLRSKIYSQKQNVRTAVDAWFMIRKKDYSKAISLLIPLIPVPKPTSDVEYSEFAKSFKQLLAISAEVSLSQNPEQTKKILSKYALPVASYRIKREEKSWMINAYTGAGGSYFIKSNELNAVLIAPIGIEKSWFTKNNKSFSAFISILDLGNMITYEDGNEEGSDLEINQLVSPGFFVSYGLSEKFPLSILGGYQANPSKFIFGLAFDLPLYRIK